MNLNLNKATFANFMSFGNAETVVDLKSLGNCLVVGNNLDLGKVGLSRNGVGKTTVIQAVTFALFGKGIDKIKADEFINLKNGKKMFVCLDFDVNGESYRIIRGRKPNRLTFLRSPGTDDETDLTRDSMANTDKDIQEVIGMTYDLFIGVYFLSPHAESFMSMSGPAQRNFIEQVLNLDVLAERADALKKMIRDEIQVDIKILGREIESANGVNARVEENVKRISTRQHEFEVDRNSKLTVHKETVELGKGIDFEAATEVISRIDANRKEAADLEPRLVELDREKNTLETEIKQLKRASNQMASLRVKNDDFENEKARSLEPVIEELSGMQSEDFYEKQAEYAKEIEERRNRLNMLDAERKTLERDLSRESKTAESKTAEYENLANGECPTCGTKDHGPRLKAKVEDTREEALEAAEKVELYEARLGEVEGAIDEHRGALSDLEAKRTKDNPEKMISRLQLLRSKRDDIEAWTNPYVDQYESMVSEYGTEEEIESRIEELEKRNQDRMDTEEEVLNTQEALRKSVNELTSKAEEDFGTADRAELESFYSEVNAAENAIKELESQVNPYIEELEEAKKQYVDVEEKQAQLQAKEDEEKHAKYLVKLLTDSKSFVRKNIVDQYIPFLNKKINEYSQQVGLGHVTEVNADLTVDILYMNKPVSYYLLSQGERMRLNTATTMAFWQLMALLGRNCNLLMIDEMFDSSLDPSGCTDMIKFVSGYADNVMLISHREEFDAYMDKAMVVTKQDGFSSLKFEDR